MANIVRFDSFEVDLDSGELRKRGSRIRLREQSFQVLACLLEHPGRLVSREDLRRRLWPDNVFVDFDNNLNSAVARLRSILGDSAERPRFIETLPRRGYRFIPAPQTRRNAFRDAASCGCCLGFPAACAGLPSSRGFAASTFSVSSTTFSTPPKHTWASATSTGCWSADTNHESAPVPVELPAPR